MQALGGLPCSLLLRERWSDSPHRQKRVSAVTSAQWSTEQPLERRCLRVRLLSSAWRLQDFQCLTYEQIVPLKRS